MSELPWWAVRSKFWSLAALATVVGVACVSMYFSGDGGNAVAASPAAASSGAGRAFFSSVDSAPGPATAPASRRQELVTQLTFADHTYCNYKDSTKYPNFSRPIGEHPDQVYPNAPVTESHAARLDGGGTDPKIQVHTSQSRVFLASGESVAFAISARDATGNPIQLFVNRAVANPIAYKGVRAPAPVTVPFSESGDASLTPSRTNLAAFNGTIRTEVHYTAGGQVGSVLFDVIYTPGLPATWSGAVREALEGGSINFYLKADVRVAGRYLVSGRVDDARGQPFAYVSFNDLLPAGTGEVKLTVFGKLMLDRQAALPLVLRDVDGYLLNENTDPDRALMPRLEGKVFASKMRTLDGVADTEWQSEERQRYLAEFRKDVEAARSELARFAPGEALPPSACK